MIHTFFYLGRRATTQRAFTSELGVPRYMPPKGEPTPRKSPRSRGRLQAVILEPEGVLHAAEHTVFEPFHNALKSIGVEPTSFGLDEKQFQAFRKLGRFLDPRDALAVFWAVRQEAERTNSRSTFKSVLNGKTPIPTLTGLMGTHSIPQEELDRASAAYLTAHERLFTNPPELDGAFKVIRQLKRAGLKLAVLTPGPAAEVMEWLRRRDLHAHFAHVIGQEEGGPQLSHEKGVRDLLVKLAVPPQNVLVVGDNYAMLAAGRAAGCKTLGVVSGRNTPADLQMAGPEKVIYHVRDIISNLSVRRARR